MKRVKLKIDYLLRDMNIQDLRVETERDGEKGRGRGKIYIRTNSRILVSFQISMVSLKYDRIWLYT